MTSGVPPRPVYRTYVLEGNQRPTHSRERVFRHDTLGVEPGAMTYPGFLILFLAPPIVMLLLVLRRRLRRRYWAALGLLMVIALVYTSPWDNYLVIRGVWTFDREKILNVFIWRVPLEEYLFYLLQVLMTGLFTIWLLGAAPSPGPSPAERGRGGRWGAGPTPESSRPDEAGGEASDSSERRQAAGERADGDG
jgi:lycopene cyclase domain-containing protein